MGERNRDNGEVNERKGDKKEGKEREKWKMDFEEGMLIGEGKKREKLMRTDV